MPLLQLPLELLIMVGYQLIDDDDDDNNYGIPHLKSFREVNHVLYAYFNPIYWQKVFMTDKLLAEDALIDAIETNNLARLKFFLEQVGVDIETTLYFDFGENGRSYSSLLIVTVNLDNVPMARLLLEKGANVHSRWKRSSAMHFARSAEMVQLLLEFNADPERVDRDDMRPLHRYISRGDNEAVRAVLQHGVEVNPFSGGGSGPLPLCTPLHQAARYNVGALSILLEFGADASKTIEYLQTPLHLAVAVGGTESVRLLVESWPDGVKARDMGSYTPLHVAASRGKIEVVRLLMEHWPEGVKAKAEYLDTPLHTAAAHGEFEVVRLLMESWPEGVKAQDEFLKTPLHWAASNGQIEVVRLLMESWPEGVKVKDKYLDTPLHTAAATGKVETLRLLMEHWPEGVKAKSKHLNTPLHMAAAHGEFEVMRLLMESWPEGVKAQDEFLKTPLHWAASNGQIEVVRLLMESWPEGVKVKDKYLNTPLHLAARGNDELDMTTDGKDRTKVVELLLERWPECIREQNENLDTPLHLASSERSRTALSKVLAERWPEGWRMENKYGQRPKSW